jgi:hypothetical protein
VRQPFLEMAIELADGYPATTFMRSSRENVQKRLAACGSVYVMWHFLFSSPNRIHVNLLHRRANFGLSSIASSVHTLAKSLSNATLAGKRLKR